MKKEIKIPSMGESISEVTIGEIFAPSGTIVKADAELLELETDKVNQALYAPEAGKVNLNVKSGEVVKIGQIIGTIESASAELTPAPPINRAPVDTPSIIPQKVSEKTMPTGSPASIQEKPAQVESSSKGSVKRYTKESFLADLKHVSSSSLKDTKSNQASEKLVDSKQAAPRETRRPMSRIRRVIAQRLVEAQQTMAMLTTFNEIDLTPVIQLREKYKEIFIKKYGCKLGFMSFFVKATLSALQTFPDLNSYIEGEDIIHRDYYNIGVAVGTEKGVIVPTLRNCDQLDFAEIEQAIEIYAKKAKDGTLAASDLQGGGFTITNGGIYGSLLSTPILLPPQCGILGMHKIEKRPVVIDNQITIRSMMYVALSYDHRLIDGKEAVSFLVHIKQILEDPSRLLLDI